MIIYYIYNFKNCELYNRVQNYFLLIYFFLIFLCEISFIVLSKLIILQHNKFIIRVFGSLFLIFLYNNLSKAKNKFYNNSFFRYFLWSNSIFISNFQTIYLYKMHWARWKKYNCKLMIVQWKPLISKQYTCISFNVHDIKNATVNFW